MRQALTVSLCVALAACGTTPEARPPAGSTAESGRAASGAASGAAGTAPSGPIVGADNPVQPIQPIENPVPAMDDCNKVEIEFAPQVPSVFVLVDRSSSMFERSFWNPLKDGVLAVIEQLQGEIRFGFSSYTGAAGMQCPQLTTVVPIADKNFAAIKRAYDTIAKPEFKGETPTSLAIKEVTQTLLKEPKNSPKFIVLVTDGEPDFCDDPNVTCSRDAVVGATQAAFTQGVGTFIFSVGGMVDSAHLGDVANAGTGQPVEDRQMAVHYQCPQSTGMYSATSGNAPYFEPDVNDRAALVKALTDTIAGVRSCVFDLQGKVQINLKLADQGVVELDGQRVPYGGNDGYRMNSETQLELLGAACMRLKRPETKRVFIDFPCEAVELL